MLLSILLRTRRQVCFHGPTGQDSEPEAILLSSVSPLLHGRDPGLTSLIVYSAAIYALIGALFALPFAMRGAGRIDPAAAEGTPGFRILVLPGTVAFWPILAWRWFRAASSPR